MGVSVDGFIADRVGAFGVDGPERRVVLSFHTRARSLDLGGDPLGRRLYETMSARDMDPVDAR